MHQHLKVKDLVAAAYAAVPTLPPAEATLMREVATRLSVTFTALTESLELRKALTKERDALNQQVVNLAVENAGLKSAKEIIRHLNCNREEANFCGIDDDFIDAAVEAMITTTTDAAIANIQAQGVEKFADDCESDVVFVEPEDTEHYELMAEHARQFAAQLRKGASND